ncbi:alanine-tRNA ligase [Plasmodium falciparum Tanzania (2000708)]|uniref:Alanine--tRNA ligase n=1 Tax=Plasmodium falciparum Tanzania (2000708) TaxID=1036725 RepID=A0A024W0I3_PLAFA|nr:alanine-tRNA ligase [Plasmodium falciparum Tanzania (2000708)]
MIVYSFSFLIFLYFCLYLNIKESIILGNCKIILSRPFKEEKKKKDIYFFFNSGKNLLKRKKSTFDLLPLHSNKRRRINLFINNDKKKKIKSNSNNNNSNNNSNNNNSNNNNSNNNNSNNNNNNSSSIKRECGEPFFSFYSYENILTVHNNKILKDQNNNYVLLHLCKKIKKKYKKEKNKKREYCNHYKFMYLNSIKRKDIFIKLNKINNKSHFYKDIHKSNKCIKTFIYSSSHNFHNSNYSSLNAFSFKSLFTKNTYNRSFLNFLKYTTKNNLKEKKNIKDFFSFSIKLGKDKNINLDNLKKGYYKDINTNNRSNHNKHNNNKYNYNNNNCSSNHFCSNHFCINMDMNDKLNNRNNWSNTNNPKDDNIKNTNCSTNDEGQKKYMSAEEVRNNFINYFHKKNHTIIESSSVVPYNDNTLLFTNAGMNQFKKIFLGNADKNSDLGKLKRAVDTQKCIRAGGKHNDLDDVGKDVYHHTFFEMLGNWSFGDYFKEESISFAWDLLTNVYKINPDRLYVTYFGGDENLSTCPADHETKKIWMKYISEDRILPFGLKENFWEMAETGPCGPCSEIHYDRIGNRDASSLVNKDDPSVLEIWNIVFMQYNKDENKNMNKLPFPCIDTGMGLERITSILQNVDSNYDTDLFQPIFKQIKELFPYLPNYEGKINEQDVDKIDTAYRVISDHIRCVTVAISDGCLPSNEGRNYVIRRIIRRAIRFGKQVFNIKSNVLWFYKLVDSVCFILGNTFKDLQNPDKINFIKNTIKQEEMVFNKTLEKGVEQFHKIIKKNTKNNIFSGKDAFDLYTSFGFPIDLIQIMCEEKSFNLDLQEFNDLFKKHQLVSDTNNFKINKFFDIPVEKSHELKNVHNINPTVDHFKYEWNNNCANDGDNKDIKFETYVQVIYDGNNFLDNFTLPSNNDEQVLEKEKSIEENKKKYALILKETNFYYENGGQIYDTGIIQNDNMKFQVLNVQKINEYVLHIGVFLKGYVSKNDKVQTIVDFDRRKLVACNHTATHMLNFMLRKVLTEKYTNSGKSSKTHEGNNEKHEMSENDINSNNNYDNNKEEKGFSIFTCEQKGSLVDDEKLRFDFSFIENINIDAITKIENEINKLIKEELNVTVKTMDLDESKKIKGIRAIFEEDYADKVNVVFINKDVNNILNNMNIDYTYLHSIELCGGTHIGNTKLIRKFLVTSEESIGKGIYRITAVTNKKADEIEKTFNDLYDKYKHVLQEPNENKLADVQNYKRTLKENKFLPYIKKYHILQELEQIEKTIVEKTKNMQKELFNKATNIGKDYAVQDKNNILLDIKFFDEIKGNQKVLEKIVQSYSKNNKNLSYFFIICDENNTYCVLEVKEALKNKNVQADLFMKEIMKSVLGHSGGSKNKAFGSVEKDKGMVIKEHAEEMLKNINK